MPAMTGVTGEVYAKSQSFVDVRTKKTGLVSRARQRVSDLRRREDLIEPLSADHRGILESVFRDLLDSPSPAPGDSFVLTPTAAEEVNTYVEEDLPRYLVHRYRYDVYPRRRRTDAFPPCLQIEPTSVCNFRCVFCYQTNRSFTQKSNGHMGQMSLDVFKSIVDQAESHVEFVTLASRGEPLLCPDLEEMLSYTRGKFLNLKLNTNASILDEKMCHAILQAGIKTLVFSADAAEDPLYSQLRVGGRLSQIVANVERFRKIRDTRYAGSGIITRVSGVKFSDAQELDSMERVWGGLVDQVAFVKYNPWENTYERPANGITTPCSDLWRRMFVWFDGTVNPCDVDYLSALSVGNVLRNSIRDLWRSDRYEELRSEHACARRQTLSPCRQCSFI